MIPEKRQDIQSRSNVSGNAARICAQNFEAVLAMIVKLAGEAILQFVLPGCFKTHSKTPPRNRQGHKEPKSRISENIVSTEGAVQNLAPRFENHTHYQLVIGGQITTLN